MCRNNDTAVFGNQNAIDDNLVMLDDYADVAVITERPYIRYNKTYDPFHKVGNITGYGDAHVKMVWLCSMQSYKQVVDVYALYY